MYEHLAKLAEKIGAQIHRECLDPQEDASEVTGEKIAEAIRAADLRWTTEPPTVEGWYWVSILYPYHGRHSHVVYVDKDQTYSAPTDWDSEHREHISKFGESNNDVRWLGPLPVPEPPKD